LAANFYRHVAPLIASLEELIGQTVFVATCKPLLEYGVLTFPMRFSTSLSRPNLLLKSLNVGRCFSSKLHTSLHLFRLSGRAPVLLLGSWFKDLKIKSSKLCQRSLRVLSGKFSLRFIFYNNWWVLVMTSSKSSAEGPQIKQKGAARAKRHTD
jgi:hypothetical protein